MNAIYPICENDGSGFGYGDLREDRWVVGSGSGSDEIGVVWIDWEGVRELMNLEASMASVALLLLSYQLQETEARPGTQCVSHADIHG